MRLHRKIPQAFGYDLIHIKRKHPTIQSHLKMLFGLLDINLVLDVGANNGQFGRSLREFGYQGHLVSFEPVRATYEKLQKRIAADDKWTARNCALGSQNKNMEINVTSETLFASFLNPNQYAKSIRAEEVPVVDVEEVEVNKLDDIFADVVSTCHDHALSQKHNTFLKMDTQGYDLEVFEGAKQTLDQIVALQSEIAVLPLYDHMPDYLEAITAYRKEGFELTGLYPITRDDQTMVLVELDCVMRRVADA